jgi:class 3 adenylate cyclase
MQQRAAARRLRSPAPWRTLSFVEPSEEIRRVIERWTMANAQGDDPALLARISNHPGTLMIGTDPEEWWRGSEALAIWTRQLEELGPCPVRVVEIDAWEEGTVGWAGVKEAVDWEGGTIESRATYVLHLERGEWKIVHVHWSFPRAKVETLGRSVTVSLDQVEATVQRERPDLSATFGVDGTVTIVFTDIVDSTPTLAQVGDRAWLDLVQRHNRVIRDVTAAHGGSVVETQGDGSMLAFASARRAVACAQAIQREITAGFSDASPPIRVRIGIHTGDAIKDSDHFFGTTVHYAARVASQAGGGEILVSNVVHDLVVGATPSFRFAPGRAVGLKGINGEHWVYPLAPD